jgi:hypothetical protein
MAITFNSAAIDGGISATGLYAHIVKVSGPRKVDATTNPSVAESWAITYGVIIHKDAATRRADNQGWNNRVPSRQIDLFQIDMANLDTYPAIAVLYADLKTKIASLATSIADA